MSGAGKCSSFITEQFALQQIAGNRGAIDFEESPVGARRKLVKQPGQHFFAGTTLAQEQNWNVYISYQGGLRTNLTHGRAGSDKKYVIAKFLDLTGISLLGGAQTLIDNCVEFSFLKRLG